MSCERPLREVLAPVEECVHKVCLAPLAGVEYLLFGESIDHEGLIHDMRAFPDAALFIETIRGIREIKSAEAHDRVFMGLRPGGLYVEDYHRAILSWIGSTGNVSSAIARLSHASRKRRI